MEEVASAFHRATIIVTSRRLNESNYQESFSQLLKIKGLSKDTQDKLVQNYLNLPEPFKQRDQYKYKYDTPSFKIAKFLHDVNKKTENVKSSDSSEENSLSPFLLFLVCFCHTESSLPIESQFSLFQNILEVMGKRCCEKMNLPLTRADRERAILRIGEFFCRQDRYHFTYGRDELQSALQEDSEFVLGFCLFCKVASRSGQSEIISYQLNHKLLHDYVKLNFIRHIVSQGRDVHPHLRNQMQGMLLEITNTEVNKFDGLQKSMAVLNIAYYMDIGDVLVKNSSINSFVKIYMKPDKVIRGHYFHFSTVPGNAATVSELLYVQFDDRLEDSFTKLFKANERAFFEFQWPLTHMNIKRIKYTENDEESCSGEFCSSLHLIKLLKKKSIVSPSSDRKLHWLDLAIIPVAESYPFLSFLFNEFFSFEQTFPLWKEDMTQFDLLHNVIGFWMTQPLREGERLAIRIPFSKSNIDFGSWTFYRWEKSENYVMIKLLDGERHVTTIEDILKDKSYLDCLSGLQESFEIRIQKEYNKELSIPQKYQVLPLKYQLEHAILLP